MRTPMTSPEQVAAEAIAVHVGDARAESIASEVVTALRDAGYLIEGGERTTETGSDNCDCGEIHPEADIYSYSGLKVMCPTCGALVLGESKHTEWHANQKALIETIWSCFPRGLRIAAEVEGRRVDG